jgi:cytosine deaminase
VLLTNATLADGQTADITISGGTIAAIGPAGPHDAPADGPVLDLRGHLLLPSLVEPHAHLDKAFLAERISNETGDLMGAILAMVGNRHRITLDDTVERAERAVRLMVSNGVTLIRTHADTTTENQLMSVEALAEVRRRTSDICDLQIVSLVSWPVTGDDGAASRALLRSALAAGADVVGGCPHLDHGPIEANDVLLGIAAEHGCDIDLHTDETLNADLMALEDLAERVIATGFPGRVTASHCVSLGVQPLATQQRVAEKVAAAGISVVALPHTNLFLQGREHQQSMPRALTAVKALRAAGVNVCAGADNLQDPFNPMGRGDPLETAALMVMAAHLLPDVALDSVSGAARQALTGSRSAVAVGCRADLVAVAAGSVREAIASAPPGRLVIRNGVLISGYPSHHETKC